MPKLKQSDLIKKGILPVQKPLFHAPPRQEVIDNWVENNVKYSPTDFTRQITQKIANNINHISFDDFLSQLKKTIKAFNEQCPEPYALCILERRPEKLEEGSSQNWVSGLAFEDCGLVYPEAIINSDNLPSFVSEYPEIKNILILDDAAYSGQQIESLLWKKIPDAALNFYFGLPFMANRAKTTLENIFANEKASIQLLPHVNMPLIKEILSKEEIKLTKTYKDTFFNNLSFDITLSYFDHKHPDFMSTFMNLENGELFCFIVDRIAYHYKIWPGYRCPEDMPEGFRAVEGVEWNQKAHELDAKLSKEPLIPIIVPPYKLHGEAALEKLAKAIESGMAGQRTQYPLLNLNQSDRFKAMQEQLNQPEGEKRRSQVNLSRFFQPAAEQAAAASSSSASSQFSLG